MSFWRVIHAFTVGKIYISWTTGKSECNSRQARLISLTICLETRYKAHPTISLMETEGSLLSKASQPEYQNDHSLPFTRGYTSNSPYVFMAQCLVKHKIHLHLYMTQSSTVQET
jgi:hypothetical protein